MCTIYRKAKRLILDFRLSNSSTDFDDLKTHFNMLANGYCVDLKKVSNSLLQGTLQVIFELLQLPLTNRGYVWNEEEVGGRSIFDLFGDCFVADVDSLRASLLDVPANPSSTKMDENEIDLDDLDEEDPALEMGPAPPPPSALQSSMEEQSDRLIGPTIPDGIDPHSPDSQRFWRFFPKERWFRWRIRTKRSVLLCPEKKRESQRRRLCCK